jgi:hypothetical protein
MVPLALCSCFGPLCDTTSPISTLDGGQAVCLKAEDCPRPGDVFVCVTTADTSAKCVACENARCITVTKESCP